MCEETESSKEESIDVTGILQQKSLEAIFCWRDDIGGIWK